MYNRSNSIYLVILLAKGQIICKMDLLILIQFNTMYCACQPAKKQEAIIFRCICAPHNIAQIQLYVDFYQNMISLMKVKSIVMTLATLWKVTQDSRVQYKSICYKKNMFRNKFGVHQVWLHTSKVNSRMLFRRPHLPC